MLDSNFGDLAYRFRWQIAFLLVGVTLTAGGVFLALNENTAGVEILTAQENSDASRIVVEVSGAVVAPNVYKLQSGARIEEAIELAGGFDESADMVWVGKYLNQAAFLEDGQKIYIPAKGNQSNSASANNQGVDETVSEVLTANTSEFVNINEATLSELDKLQGIGPVYAQKIIENRPYSTVEDLSSKGIIPDKTFESIKESISVY